LKDTQITNLTLKAVKFPRMSDALSHFGIGRCSRKLSKLDVPLLIAAATDLPITRAQMQYSVAPLSDYLDDLEPRQGNQFTRRHRIADDCVISAAKTYSLKARRD
jgi:hypothetical protein